MPTLTELPIADLAATDTTELVDVVVRFVENLSDVIDRMQSHSCGYLDHALLTELRDTIEDEAWRALEAYHACCWLEVDLAAVVAAVKAGRAEGC